MLRQTGLRTEINTDCGLNSGRGGTEGFGTVFVKHVAAMEIELAFIKSKQGGKG